MENRVYKVLLAGEGGQGVQTIGHVLARAAFEQGLNVAYMPNYGVEQRGGVSLGYLQIGTGIIGFPKFSKADYIVNMRSRAIERIIQYVDSDTLYIYDSDLINNSELKTTNAQKLPIAATSTASSRLSPQIFNMILTGAILYELKVIERIYVEKALDIILAKKYKEKPQLRNFNKKALEIGAKLAKEAFSPVKKTSVLDRLGDKK